MVLKILEQNKQLSDIIVNQSKQMNEMIPKIGNTNKLLLRVTKPSKSSRLSLSLNLEILSNCSHIEQVQL